MNNEHKENTGFEIKAAEGGVCAPKGFTAAGISCGIKNNESKDLALIAGDCLCAAAAVYTSNKVKGAPLEVTRRNIADGRAQAVICNSGNANTCAPGGEKLAEDVCALTAEALGIKKEDVVVSSTGVIGQELSLEPFKEGIPRLKEGLGKEGGKDAAEAILTTDTRRKSIAVEFNAGGKVCRMGGMAKGSGMINPNMATMLSFITTDADISPQLLQRALSETVKDSFNQISVDGDTSTNDMVVILASGRAGNSIIEKEGKDFDVFSSALREVSVFLSRELARDGEGATKLIECLVENAPDREMARAVSKSVISSDLLKAAVFGEDANWGRVLCAIGYTEGDFSVENIDVDMESSRGRVTVCRESRHKEYSEEKAAEVLSADEIKIRVNMNQGSESASAWGCDLSYDYVRINGDYRT
ncbi:MAG TPA: bifunctional glutamate N-acetyltransferase/amino-acid acetyltransferase ArgJ [Candidatus Copromorpha excrementigallinarum]|uniref:Arginine biosynthesis bifunctional protein ArgJ n=1 Tax=Candidatus Allocopromorpha excrementigallinarum TaxID=2840742 RepID=A0A9D1I152_9FIRM|nr:bifunctional glutamate N-acetyltransferase/amino-acid acetyltransferase ArgJ [Candidatus Copromorpha excrementigallinarum]